MSINKEILPEGNGTEREKTLMNSLLYVEQMGDYATSIDSLLKELIDRFNGPRKTMKQSETKGSLISTDDSEYSCDFIDLINNACGRIDTTLRSIEHKILDMEKKLF